MSDRSDSSKSDAPPRHHGADGVFQNNYQRFEAKGLAELLRWRLEARREGRPRPPLAPIPQCAPELDFIAANSGGAQTPAVTWIGHATALAQLGGLNLLTDPIFSERASPLGFVGPKRQQPPGLTLAQLPSIDLVLVSHNHYDHLDEASVRALARQGGRGGEGPLFVVPLGLAAWFQRCGIARVVELDWWQGHRMQSSAGEIELVLVPAQHWSGRGLGDRMKTLWGGFALFAPDCHLFYAGDTGYSRDFADMRQRFAGRQSEPQGGGFDIALLPIGAYEPRWFMRTQHVNVEEAIRIHRDLGAKRSLGLHWGTFALSDEALDEPPRELARQRAAQDLAQDEFFTLAIGETRRLPPRKPISPDRAG
ncbi:MBL fold metallo-hydrolase [Roseateles violae]|uniref:MBL fold metallo-hydrolase n=1 Tax=Roseateles violae TaxID=3058042 RepID=A0ABT8DWJ3_9BURK|nr:MBL fold metallo-hydrolase [Pelomonas sp. PFR6]MDN3921274.1 MBL fold metallo-hydrolase [Pelomonas sp. PFR6]